MSENDMNIHDKEYREEFISYAIEVCACSYKGAKDMFFDYYAEHSYDYKKSPIDAVHHYLEDK